MDYLVLVVLESCIKRVLGFIDHIQRAEHQGLLLEWGIGVTRTEKAWGGILIGAECSPEGESHQVDHQRGLWGAPGLWGNICELRLCKLRLWWHVLNEPATEMTGRWKTASLVHTNNKYVENICERFCTHGLKMSSSSSSARRSMEPKLNTHCSGLIKTFPLSETVTSGQRKQTRRVRNTGLVWETWYLDLGSSILTLLAGREKAHDGWIDASGCGVTGGYWVGLSQYVFAPQDGPGWSLESHILNWTLNRHS